MRNTKYKGVVHFRIFKWGGRYLGICKEMGFVEEADNLDDTKHRLINGTVAVLMAVAKSKENLEASLNTSPPFKYAVFYHIAPLLVMIESAKDALNKGGKEVSGNYSFFNEKISALTSNG